MTGEGVKDLIEAAWPIVATAREQELRAMAFDLDQDREPAADYNPALVAPLRDSKKHKKKRR